MKKTKFRVFNGEKEKKKNKGQPDAILFNVILVLLCFGLVMCFSASAPSANQNMGDSYYYFRKQLTVAIVGFVGMLIAMRYDYHKLAQKLPLFFWVTLALLGLVLLFPEYNGGKRWINLGVSFQPSELAKFTVILWFACKLSAKKQKWNKPKDPKTFVKYFVQDFVPYLGFLAIFVVLLMLEPHFSCTILIFAVGMVMLFVAGMNWGYLVAIAAPVLTLGVWLVSFGYRSARIASWLDPFANPQGEGWQIIQSLLAIGSGGMFGLGLGQSRQKFLWLPEPYNDFIFAVLCEELGFVGAVCLIALFAVLIWRGICIAQRAPDLLGTLLAVGITALMALQVVINIAVVTGTIPVTGMPLPFFSSGGTALIFTMAEMGVLLNISCQGKAVAGDR
ncbi:MAG: putative lipid II flippase FtsW [Clostridia bacterium]|nr:putative lipid II flippase FtsW [Clostridia bacterium]